MIRVDMETIRKAGRNTSGVKVVSVEGKDVVQSLARCPKEEIDEGDEIFDDEESSNDGSLIVSDDAPSDE